VYYGAVFESKKEIPAEPWSKRDVEASFKCDRKGQYVDRWRNGLILSAEVCEANFHGT
jgi:hypothetical protein